MGESGIMPENWRLLVAWLVSPIYTLVSPALPEFSVKSGRHQVQRRNK
jgi:hypothetical protein